MPKETNHERPTPGLGRELPLNEPPLHASVVMRGFVVGANKIHSAIIGTFEPPGNPSFPKAVDRLRTVVYLERDSR